MSPPMAQPRTVPSVVQVRPLGKLVTVYPVTAAPPLSAGGAQRTRTDVFPACRRTLRGAVGGSAGVTRLDGADRGPVPPPDIAATWNV